MSRVAWTTIGTLALVASAAFGSALKTRSDDVQLAPGDKGFAAARCEPPLHVVSGGFIGWVNPEDLGIGRVHPSLSKRARSRTWKASGVNDDAEAPGNLKALAYCSNEGARLETAREATWLESSRTQTLTATCDRGSTAISGGFAGGNASTDARVMLLSSRRAARRKWTATGVNLGDATLFRVFAYCVEGGRRFELESETVTVPAAAAPDGTGTATATCEEGSRAVSGGFAGTFDDDGDAEVYPHVSKKVGARRWRVRGVPMGSGSGDLTAYVYCEKR